MRRTLRGDLSCTHPAVFCIPNMVLEPAQTRTAYEFHVHLGAIHQLFTAPVCALIDIRKAVHRAGIQAAGTQTSLTYTTWFF